MFTRPGGGGVAVGAWVPGVRVLKVKFLKKKSLHTSPSGKNGATWHQPGPDAVEEVRVRVRVGPDTVGEVSVRVRLKPDAVEKVRVRVRVGPDTVEEVSVRVRLKPDAVEEVHKNSLSLLLRVYAAAI